MALGITMRVLRSLLDQALVVAQDDPEGPATNYVELCRLLDVSGSQNRHLENPRNRGRVGHIYARDQPLSGDEYVFGDLLLLVYCAHDPFARLLDFDDQSALERHLMSDSGPLNPFITYSFVFRQGSLWPFRVTCRCDKSGKTFTFGQLGAAESVWPAGGCVERSLEWLSDT